MVAGCRILCVVWSRIVAQDNRSDAYTGDTIVVPRVRARRNGNGAPPPPPPRPRARPRQRRVWPLVRNAMLVVLLLVLVVVVVLYLQVRDVASDIVVADVRTNPPLVSPLLGGTNVLIIGVDERKDNPQEGVRSDTLLLAHLDGVSGWANMLSIPRDTQVELADVGTTKINVAYGQGYAFAEELYGAGTTPQQGGMALSAQTVEQFLHLRDQGVRVDYTAQINFDGFAALIDALGGVDIDVPTAIVDDEYPTPDFQTIRVEFAPGVQHMDGARALIYARTRHGSSDFERTARQQQVVRAIVEAFRARGGIGRIAAVPSLLKSLQGAVTTTMPIDRPDVLLGMMLLAARVDPSEIGQLRLSPEVVPSQEVAGGNLLWDDEGVRTLVGQWLTRVDERSEDALVQVLNGTDVAGLGGRRTSELEDAGFRVTVAGNATAADGGPFEQTTVYDLKGKPNTARRIAQALGADTSAGPLPEGVASDADIVVILGKDNAR